ncbi:MAG: hypothetical protein GY804_15125, partial [Alphaproteobacteria bacterium]|nr:hypothetical protein [Alphaproteobacteria bacterium]
MKYKILTYALGVISIGWFISAMIAINQNAELIIVNAEQETRINEQSDLIRDMTVITTAYDNLIVEYEALTREYQDYRDNKEQRVAIDPIENLFDADEIPELLKSIPTGTPFRGSFSVTSPFGESVGFHGSLRDDHQGTDMTPDGGNWIVTPIGDGV